MSLPARVVTDRRRARTIAAAVALVLAAMPKPAFAQDEARLRQFFEGRRVTVKIDMPATSAGVDLKVDTAQPMDFRQYGDRVRTAGVAIAAGETAMVTLVRVKSDLVEFQLDGGGYSGGGGSVYLPDVDKSNREKDLEKEVKAETDPARRRTLQRELDDLVNARNRENARIRRERARLEEEAKARVAAERVRAGSRFNLRYAKAVPVGLSADEMMVALREYVDFSDPPSAPARPVVADVRRADGAPRKGMLRADAERELGAPVETTERREGALTVTTLVFTRGDQRITAEFVEGVLVRYTIASR